MTFIIIYVILYQNTRGVSMALAIKDGKVINVSPPKTLTKEQRKALEDAPINHELIKRATSRKYNVVKPW